jgi:hypothetical protein
MKPWLIVPIAAALLAGCNDQAGRYVVTPGDPPIMVDSTTGESWRLIPDAGNNPHWVKLMHDIEPPH